MPCYKCSNGKYKYGKEGNCQFDSLGHCLEAERAIHARENKPKKEDKSSLEKPKPKRYNS